MFYSTKQFSVDDTLGGNKYDEKNKYYEWMCPLGEALWPDKVKTELTDFLSLACFVSQGIFRPLEQFLVEPFAYAFGGKNIDGIAVLENVEWDLMVAWYQNYLCGVTHHDIPRNKIKKVDAKFERYVGTSYRTIYLMHVDIDDYGLPVEALWEWGK